MSTSHWLFMRLSRPYNVHDVSQKEGPARRFRRSTKPELVALPHKTAHGPTDMAPDTTMTEMGISSKN